MRIIKFQNEYFYHIYNRGADKREVFCDERDYLRFIRSMNDFNHVEPIGSLYQQDYINQQNKDNKKELNSQLGIEFLNGQIIEIICYTLLPNHFHLLIKQTVDQGITKYMHKLGVGYTN